MIAELKPYRDEDVALTGFLASGAANGDKRPGILVVHGGAGPATLTPRAAGAAPWPGLGYVAFACDMYGDGVAGDRERVMAAGRRSCGIEPAPASRRRAEAGLGGAGGAAGSATGAWPPWATALARMAALRLARAGGSALGRCGEHPRQPAAPLVPARAGAWSQARVLVCHGALDPHVPITDLTAFVEEMTQAEADWQLMV